MGIVLMEIMHTNEPPIIELLIHISHPFTIKIEAPEGKYLS
jgi:hypothetical protein